MEESFICAAFGGNLETMKYLIKKDIKPDLGLALEKAAFNGYIKVVKYLVEHLKIDVVKYGANAARAAYKNGDVVIQCIFMKILQLILLKRGHPWSSIYSANIMILILLINAIHQKNMYILQKTLPMNVIHRMNKIL
ncbi:Hypothetical protein HVR_LOCUS244 [uncultured virus]|nr:Hypothetical protein HVR_LOCUS244 [uncultured virus]